MSGEMTMRPGPPPVPQQPGTTGGSAPRSLEMVKPKRWAIRLALLLIVLVMVVVIGLIYIPWQQSVTGNGRVFIYSAMDRPQNIEAQIPGRLVRWRVNEGDLVEKDSVVAELDDLDSKFLDANQARRLLFQKQALLRRRTAAQSRADALEGQIAFLTKSQKAAVPAAVERIQQAQERLRSAQQALEASRQGQRAAEKASVPAAEERTLQARDQVRAAEQAVEAAQQDLKTSQLNRERIRDLYAKQLRSQRDDELAENDLVSRRTALERAKFALEVAKRAANVNVLDQTRVDTERERARAEVERAAAALEIARRDTTVARLDQAKLLNDTSATMASVEASLHSARETIASVNSDLQKLEVELQNVRRRNEQQIVRAPRKGRIVRLMKVGAGETVKAGDVMAVLAPETQDQAVELLLTDNDAPLVRVGRSVRLQFAGWPALQFAGFPSVSVGTFGGRVKVMDAVDDGKSRYRIIVEPDRERIKAGQDEAWPPLTRLRPGAEVTGWIMLDTVPLGFELWRQFNAFPPTVSREDLYTSDKKESKKPDKSDEKK